MGSEDSEQIRPMELRLCWLAHEGIVEDQHLALLPVQRRPLRPPPSLRLLPHLQPWRVVLRHDNRKVQPPPMVRRAACTPNSQQLADTRMEMCTGEMQDSIETANNIALSKFVKGRKGTIVQCRLTWVPPTIMLSSTWLSGTSSPMPALRWPPPGVGSDSTLCTTSTVFCQQATRPSEPQRWSAVQLK